jgi:threonine synthase
LSAATDDIIDEFAVKVDGCTRDDAPPAPADAAREALCCKVCGGSTPESLKYLHKVVERGEQKKQEDVMWSTLKLWLQDPDRKALNTSER